MEYLFRTVDGKVDVLWVLTVVVTFVLLVVMIGVLLAERKKCGSWNRVFFIYPKEDEKNDTETRKAD